MADANTGLVSRMIMLTSGPEVKPTTRVGITALVKGRGTPSARTYAGKTAKEWEKETGKVPPGSAWRPGIQVMSDAEWKAAQEQASVPTPSVKKPPVFTPGSKQGDVYVDKPGGNVIQYLGGGEQRVVGREGKVTSRGTEIRTPGGALVGYLTREVKTVEVAVGQVLPSGAKLGEIGAEITSGGVRYVATESRQLPSTPPSVSKRAVNIVWRNIDTGLERVASASAVMGKDWIKTTKPVVVRKVPFPERIVTTTTLPRRGEFIPGATQAQVNAKRDELSKLKTTRQLAFKAGHKKTLDTKIAKAERELALMGYSAELQREPIGVIQAEREAYPTRLGEQKAKEMEAVEQFFKENYPQYAPFTTAEFIKERGIELGARGGGWEVPGAVLTGVGTILSPKTFAELGVEAKFAAKTAISPQRAEFLPKQAESFAKTLAFQIKEQPVFTLGTLAVTFAAGEVVSTGALRGFGRLAKPSKARSVKAIARETPLIRLREDPGSLLATGRPGELVSIPKVVVKIGKKEKAVGVGRVTIKVDKGVKVTPRYFVRSVEGETFTGFAGTISEGGIRPVELLPSGRQALPAEIPSGVGVTTRKPVTPEATGVRVVPVEKPGVAPSTFDVIKWKDIDITKRDYLPQYTKDVIEFARERGVSQPILARERGLFGVKEYGTATREIAGYFPLEQARYRGELLYTKGKISHVRLGEPYEFFGKKVGETPEGIVFRPTEKPGLRIAAFHTHPGEFAPMPSIADVKAFFSLRKRLAKKKALPVLEQEVIFGERGVTVLTPSKAARDVAVVTKYSTAEEYIASITKQRPGITVPRLQYPELGLGRPGKPIYAAETGFFRFSYPEKRGVTYTGAILGEEVIPKGKLARLKREGVARTGVEPEVTAFRGQVVTTKEPVYFPDLAKEIYGERLETLAGKKGRQEFKLIQETAPTAVTEAEVARALRAGKDDVTFIETPTGTGEVQVYSAEVKTLAKQVQKAPRGDLGAIGLAVKEAEVAKAISKVEAGRAITAKTITKTAAVTIQKPVQIQPSISLVAPRGVTRTIGLTREQVRTRGVTIARQVPRVSTVTRTDVRLVPRTTFRGMTLTVPRTGVAPRLQQLVMVTPAQVPRSALRTGTITRQAELELLRTQEITLTSPRVPTPTPPIPLLLPRFGKGIGKEEDEKRKKKKPRKKRFKEKFLPIADLLSKTLREAKTKRPAIQARPSVRRKAFRKTFGLRVPVGTRKRRRR